MSLIEQARELVQGIVSPEGPPDRPATAPTAAADLRFDRSEAERIRREWDAQPHHP